MRVRIQSRYGIVRFRSAIIEEAPLEFIIPGLIVKDETTMMTGDFGSFKTYMSYFFADVSVKAECS